MPDLIKTHGFKKGGKRHVTPKKQDPSFPASARSSTKQYDRKWRRFREHFLRRNPVCVECKKNGVIELATEVDHINPHKGDMAKFWDNEFQALCKPHHSKKTAMENAQRNK